MRLFCYCVILGGYDDLPTFKHVPANVECVVFTDDPSSIGEAPGWTVVPIDSYFHDKKTTVSFLKTMPHRIFGSDAASIWVDANFRDIDVGQFTTPTAPIVVPRHSQRDSVNSEIRAVVNDRLENSFAASWLKEHFSDQDFCDDVGLSETGFLYRDHRNSRVRSGCEYWWSLLSTIVRRDQLTFDFAFWKAGISVHHIDNQLLSETPIFSIVRHKRTVGRVLDRTTDSALRHRAKLRFPKLPESYPNEIYYVFENILQKEITLLAGVNELVEKHSSDGKVEGNYCHFDGSRIKKYTPSDPRRSWKREYLRHAIRGCTNMLEVGFNAGHSAAIILGNEPNIRLHSIDICRHPYTEPCANYFLMNMAERFRFTKGDSRNVLYQIDLRLYDIVHIDGGHDPLSVQSDLKHFCERAKPKTLLVVNDVYAQPIAVELMKWSKQGALKPIERGFPSSGENMLFQKLV